ncbi:hypothetical protein [Clostridium estertheticum]|uniref:hypothetical protein n=1 Tax=Clostridium estertheticum TaxID=238834 RepID=UPI001C0BC805|nr:hypothetical protein [Clostridium estertheticum]MBU3172456.1 hypothetical protein [Clostridium estertheticum]
MSNFDEFIIIDKKELKKWRIIGVIVYMIWFFFGGEIIEGIGFSIEGLGFIMYVISYYIPYFFLERILYRPTFFEKIYGVKWSKESEARIHSK